MSNATKFIQYPVNAQDFFFIMVCIILNLVIDIMNLHVSINIVLYLLLKSVVGMKKLVKNNITILRQKLIKKSILIE